MQKTLKNKEVIAIWKAVQNDDQEAFDRFYLLFVPLLFNYGHKICPRTAVVEDSIQELFVTLWKKRKELHFQQSPKAYLFLSFRRILLTQIQAQSPEVLKASLQQIPDSTLNGSVTSEVIHQQKKQVKQAIECLPKRQKEALFLKYYENMDYDEISNIMSINKGAVYKLVSKAIQKLRSQLRMLL